MSDVVGSEPRRSGRGWWVVVAAVGVVGAATLLRPDEPGSRPTDPVPRVVWKTPGASGGVAGATVGPDVPPAPAPRLSAPPPGPNDPRIVVTTVSETEVARGDRVVYRAPEGDRITTYVPLPTGFAAVVQEDPVRSANPWTLVVRNGARTRTFTVDEETRAVHGHAPAVFWTTRAGVAQRRGLDGTVTATERVPAPWIVLGGTSGGLAVEDVAGKRVGFLLDGRVTVLASETSYVATTARHVAYTRGLCIVSCDVVVRAAGGRDEWVLGAPEPGVAYQVVAIDRRGEQVAVVAGRGGTWTVYVGDRTSRTARSVARIGEDGLGYLTAAWTDEPSLAVFDVSDDVRAFAVTRPFPPRLVGAGTYRAQNLVEVYADEAG